MLQFKAALTSLQPAFNFVNQPTDPPEAQTDQFSKDKLGQLLESYRPWSRVFVRKQLHGNFSQRVDESDVIQNAWLNVVRKLDQFHGSTEQEFFCWLRTILENNLKNVYRENMAEKRDIRKELNFNQTESSASLEWIVPVADDSTPSNRLIRGERALELAKALEELPKMQRIAIELRHLQGKKLSDVAAEMEKTPDAVVSLLRRAMLALNKLLN